MKIDPSLVRLYAVTDRNNLKDKTLPQAVEEAVLGGATMIQLREKTLNDRDLLALAKEIKDVTDYYRVPLIINDRPDIALRCGAAGVHLGQEDGSVQEARRLLGPEKIIGVSAHNASEAVAAEAAGADYLGAGAVFSTSTKKNTVPVTAEALQEISQSVSIPVAAIGGITASRIPSLKDTGIDGVAVVSAVFGDDRPAEAASQLSKALRSAGIGTAVPSSLKKLRVKGAIFDVDGTILDSMPMWCSVGSRFLEKNGLHPMENIDRQMATRTLEESAGIFREIYGIPGTVPEIVAGMIDMVREDYCFRLQCKPGVSDVIRELHQQNVPLYIATATDRDMIEAALTRLELDSCFKGIITCGELGVPKTRPDIYRYASKELGTRPEETLVFEDVLHAVRTASSAGFPVVSVYDRESVSDRDEMEALSVLYLNSFGAWPGIRTV